MTALQLITNTQPAAMNRKQLTLLILVLGALTAFGAMSIDMYLPAFPQIAHDLGIPLGTVQLSISAFLFGSAAGQIFYGPLADRYGRRLPLLAGLALYTISAIGCALVHSGSGLLFWRVVMAVGGGAGMVISRSVVRDLYDTAEAARMFSLLMLIMGAAPILAPLLGGQILLVAGWRGIFAFLAAFGIASLGASAAFLPESLPPEKRIARPMSELISIYGTLLQERRYLLYAIALGCVSGINFAYIAGVPFLFIELHHISPQQFGLFFGVNACGLIGASQLNRRLLRRISAERIVALVFLITLIAALALTAAVSTNAGGFGLQVALIFICLCLTGLLYPNLTALALAPFKRTAGSASALLGTIQYSLGATAGAVVSGLHSGTAIPMTGTMTACALAGWLATAATRLKGVSAASSVQQ